MKLLLALFFSLGQINSGAPGQHTLTVTFKYDFTVNSACSATVTTGCLKQFNIYDTTAGAKTLIFSISGPLGATGPVPSIAGTSPPFILTAGAHSIAATAAMADGTESAPATATFSIAPDAPVGCTVTIQ